MIAVIEIPGKPLAKKRPKFARRGKLVTVYDPGKKEQDEIKTIIRSLWKKNPIDTAVELKVVFCMPVPKSWSKKKREAHLGNPHVVKQDIDNLLKKVLDCMNEIVFTDDRKVWKVAVSKIYSDTPRTEVAIKWIEEQLDCCEN